MDQNTKLQIRGACEKQGPLTIEHHPYDVHADMGHHAYIISADGNIIMETYNIDKVYNCGCFGCDISTTKTEESLIGTCDDLAFLDNY